MTTLSTATRTALANALANLVDAGTAAGEFRIYTTGFATLLCTAVCPDPAFDPAVAGVCALAAPITGAAVVASGTAAVFRLVDSDGNVVLEGTVGTSGADLVFPSLAWTAGDLIDLSAYTLTVPAS